MRLLVPLLFRLPKLRSVMHYLAVPFYNIKLSQVVLESGIIYKQKWLQSGS